YKLIVVVSVVGVVAAIGGWLILRPRFRKNIIPEVRVAQAFRTIARLGVFQVARREEPSDLVAILQRIGLSLVLHEIAVERIGETSAAVRRASTLPIFVPLRQIPLVFVGIRERGQAD